MPKVTLAPLTEVNMEDVWDREPTDFTRWLAESENLRMLGGTLGIDLQPEQTEARVGSSRLRTDILARDVNNDRVVVIENQFGLSDHAHLGKLVTYGAIHRAKVMIWLAGKFRPEHEEALDSLNQRTDMGSEFYGVGVRVLRIADSPHACTFTVVARPSVSQRSLAHASEGDSQPTDRNQAYQQFWQDITDRLRDDHRLTSVRQANAFAWQAFATGIRDVVYILAFRRGRRAQVGLELRHSGPDKRLYHCLHENKERIEGAFGQALEWEESGARSQDTQRIVLYQVDRTIKDDERALRATADWMTNTITKLRDVVVPIIRDAAAEIDKADKERAAGAAGEPDDEADLDDEE